MAVSKFVYADSDIIEIEKREFNPRLGECIRAIQYSVLPSGQRQIKNILECTKADVKYAFRKYGVHLRRITKGREYLQ